jgi:hypothetical protein
VYRIVSLRIRCGPRIIPYGVNVLIPAPYRSRGWGYRSGWPSYSHRPASIDPPGILSIAVTLSRLRSHRSERFDGQRLTALRVTDRPRLIGWSSLHPTCHRSLTSLCRRHRHRLAGSRTDRKLARPAPCGACLALTCATKPTTPAVPCGPSSAPIETPSVVPRKTGFTPVTTPVLAFLLENVARARAPFSPRSRRSVRQHVERKPPRLAPRRSSRLAAPRPSRRAMRRTDFCHFTSFVPVPAPRRFSVHRTLARPRDRGDRLIRRQCDSLRWVARSLAGVVAPGVVLLS